MIMRVDLKYVDQAVERIGRAPEAVIPSLQALQDHYGYLPEEALRRVGRSATLTVERDGARRNVTVRLVDLQ